MSLHQRIIQRLDDAKWLPYAVWVACAGYAWLYLYRGWIPWDVGTLGHAAERVMAGELPHRDFTEVYSGGLAFLNAAVFSVVGIGVAPMRWVVYSAYLLWIPAVWWLASRAAPRSLAATATLLAATLTLPMYAEAMPNWFILFLATWGLVALKRYLDTGQRRWLLLAGVTGGLAITIKIIGLYFLTASFLLLVFVENDQDTIEKDSADTTYRTAVASLLGLLVVVVLLLAGGSGGLPGILYYATPTLAAVTVLLDRLRHASTRGSKARFAALGADTGILLAGATVPLVVFVMPFLVQGALGDMVYGVLVLPFTRFETVTAPFPATRGILAVGVAVWATSRASSAGDSGKYIAMATWAVVLAGLWYLDGNVRLYLEVILHLGALVPVLVLAAAWSLTVGARESSPGSDPALRFLLLAATGLLTLVHLPTPASPYVFFVAPLAVLVVVSTGSGALTLGRLHMGLGVTLAVMVLHMNPMFIRPPDQTEPFALERARGIRVPPGEKSEYETMAQIVVERATSEYVLAIPDSPEVYFLTGLKNPLGSFYDLFEDPDGRTERILAKLDEHGIDVVVVNNRPSYSAPVADDLMAALQARYPSAVTVGRFTIAWASAGG